MREGQAAVLMNVDPETLEVVISDRKLSPLAIPTAIDGGLVRMPPMWEAIYFHYLYAEHYRHQTEVPLRKQAAACLALPPTWLVCIAAVMWEGIIQGVAWDVVKMSVAAAISSLREPDSLRGTPAPRRRASRLRQDGERIPVQGRSSMRCFCRSSGPSKGFRKGMHSLTRERPMPPSSAGSSATN